MRDGYRYSADHRRPKYDETGHVLTTTDANSHTTTVTYDGNYRRASVTNPIGAVVSYTYDGVGNLLTQTATNGEEDDQTTTYAYDAASRRVSEIYPDQETSPASTYTRSFAYNKVNSLTQRTDQNGDITTYSYDDLHRLTGRSYTVGGSSPTYPTTQGPDSFTYDLAGRMLGADRDYPSPVPDSTLAYEYDAAGRVTDLTQDEYVTGYAYSVGSGSSRKITYPSGRVIVESMDRRDRVHHISEQEDELVYSIIATGSYDLANRLTYRGRANGTHTDWTYDTAGRVVSIEHRGYGSPGTLLAGVAYGRDAVGNPLYREDLETAGHSEVYTYDAADRLVQFKRGELNEGKTDVDTYTSDANLTQRQTWTLDDLGNWAVNELQQDSVSVAQAATANMADEYTTIDFDGPGGDDPVEFAHDHNGNLKDDGTYLYDYDIENRMTRVRQKSGGATIAVYQYDAMGRRIRKTISNLGSGTDGTFEFVNSPEWQVLELNRTAGSAAFDVVAYVHAGQSAYIDDHVAYAVDTDPWTYYHADAQYNTLTTTNSTGDVGQRFLLDPYGHFVTYNSTWTTVSLAPPAEVLFVHQGLVSDGEAEKYQNRFREYSSTLGRFAQRDSLRDLDRTKVSQHCMNTLQALRVHLSLSSTRAEIVGRFSQPEEFNTARNHALMIYLENSPTRSVDPLGLFREESAYQAGRLLGCYFCLWLNMDDIMEPANELTDKWADRWGVSDSCKIDAMQHCIGAALAAQKCGAQCARDGGDAHDSDSSRDRHNNNEGSECAGDPVGCCNTKLINGELDTNHDSGDEDGGPCL